MRGEPASGACGPSEQAARTARALFCVAPSEPPCFELRQMAARRIPHGDVLERRLLTPKDACRFPLVLGNDVTGSGEDGPGITRSAAWTLVFGVLSSGRDGAQARHATVTHAGVTQRSLPIGRTGPLSQAPIGFAHVANGHGRLVRELDAS